jgi:hypothetical protein
MHRLLLYSAFLGSLPALLVAGVARERGAWDPVEDQAELFGSEKVARAVSKVETSPWTLRIDATIEKWAGLALVFPPQPGPTGRTSGAMALRQIAKADSIMDGTNSQENWCSTSQYPTFPTSYGSDCSVNASNANVNNITCSAIGNAGVGTYYCSTGSGGPTSNSTCSTSGGATSGGTNGAVGCSAGYNSDQTQQRNCSTQGNMTPPAGNLIICSTFQGQHQACSSGMPANASGPGAAGDSAFCSASPGQSTGNNFCSAQQGQAAAGANGNKCSAMNMPWGGNNPPENGSRSCSVGPTPAMGSQSSNFCSITSGAAATGNAACTVMNAYPPNTPGNPPGTATCSAYNATGGVIQGSGNCSVYNSSTGTVTQPTNGVCGSMGGHFGTIP